MSTVARGALLVAVLGAATAACGDSGAYCQSGAKYGTQCYTPSQVSDPAFQPYDMNDRTGSGVPAPAGSQPR
ncbi:MAG: hypothetical protein HY908_06415 [Myxococcales bacterium]|nr:hypothetical protein [Myxococcales bacterium]